MEQVAIGHPLKHLQREVVPLAQLGYEDAAIWKHDQIVERWYNTGVLGFITS